MVESERRVVPGPLKKLLEADIAFTKQFCRAGDKIIPLAKYKKYFTLVEYSCHGVAWIFFSCASLWLLWNANMFQSQVNFIFGILLDISMVLILKAFCRRRRPVAYDEKLSLKSVGLYTFPSGHASRAFFVWYFFARLSPVHPIFQLVVLVWAAAVAYSRLALRRNHLIDVTAGVLLGLSEGCLLSFLWLSGPTAAWIVSFLTEEALNLEGLHDGGEIPVD